MNFWKFSFNSFVYFICFFFQADDEGISLEQGQIVEVLDKKNPQRWLVRTKVRKKKHSELHEFYLNSKI